MAERKTRVIRTVNGMRVFDLGSTGIPSFGIGPTRKGRSQK